MKNPSLPTHWKAIMAMQVKHTVSIGLGLGIATALGYHFLSGPKSESEAFHSQGATPLNSYEITPAPSAISSTAPVPVQPQLDNSFRVEAQPLESTAIEAMTSADPTTSYEELVSAMQPVPPIPDGPAQQSAESDDSYGSFSLDLGSPEGSDSTNFALDGGEQVFPQTASEIFTEDDTLAAASAAMVATQNEGESSAVVAGYNSKSTNGSSESATGSEESQTNGWKANPFINSSSVASVTKPASPASALNLSQANELQLQDGPVATIQNASPAQANSVLSLNDSDYGAADVSDQVGSMQPAGRTPNVSQPGQYLARSNDPVAPASLPALGNADAQKAVHHIEYGKTLSRRGAAFTARQEFLAAMQVIAAANDRVSGSNHHSKALQMAMLTIKEAGDFSVANSEQQIQMDVPAVVEIHRSEVLTVDQAAYLSPVQAMNRYFAKAQEYLDLAGGRNVVSAEVFYCMGKLHSLLNRNQKVISPYETAKSVLYHQVALLSDNQHHRSANELGVLLARNGRLEQSKLLFERSLMSKPTVRTWQNLAETHRRLGEIEFANQAVAEVQILASGQSSAVQPNIQWKPVEQFNADAPVEFNQQRVAQLPEPPTNPVAAPSKRPATVKSIAEKLRGIF